MNVALFITCLIDTFFPRTGEAIVRVLRHFGCTVHFPRKQTCCGQPAFNSGFHDEARPLARRMIEMFEPYDHVVSPSASCVNMVKHHFPLLLEADAAWRDRAAALADRTHEFAAFLGDHLHVDIAAHLRMAEPCTFHYPCHARGLYDVDDLVAWLGGRDAELLRIPERPDLCCGFGGMFSVEQPEISGAMVRDKLAELRATGAGLVICNEGGCGLQIAGAARRQGLSLRFKHIADCLAESLGLLEPEP